MNLGTGSYCQMELRDSIKVGNYSSIAAGCYFHEVNDQHLCVRNRKCVYTINWDQPADGKETVIGSDVWIGTGAKIFSGVTIGDGAIIGAHTVVTKDVPPFAVVVGNPGRVKRYRFSKEQIKKLLEIRWWDKSEANSRKDEMKDIDTFLEKYG